MGNKPLKWKLLDFEVYLENRPSSRLFHGSSTSAQRDRERKNRCAVSSKLGIQVGQRRDVFALLQRLTDKSRALEIS